MLFKSKENWNTYCYDFCSFGACQEVLDQVGGAKNKTIRWPKAMLWLQSHDKIAKVNFPGLKSFPQYELGLKQMTGTTGLMRFQLKTNDLEKIKTFFNGLELFQIGVSWGGHESLIYAPAINYLKELSEERFEGLGISLGDMRISVNLESAEDLINDLNNSLNKF